jgi:hypothetical protein
MGCPQDVVTLGCGVVEALGVGHPGIDHRLEGSPEGGLVDLGPKPRDDAFSHQSADSLGRRIRGQMDPVAEHLPRDSPVRLKNSEDFSVYRVDRYDFICHTANSAR